LNVEQHADAAQRALPGAGLVACFTNGLPNSASAERTESADFCSLPLRLCENGQWDLESMLPRRIFIEILTFGSLDFISRKDV
jgi:hypothetical protein